MPSAGGLPYQKQHQPRLPIVLLWQLGCSYGKSTILAVYAKYLAAVNPESKVVICTPKGWLSNDICTHLTFTQQIDLLAQSCGLFVIEQDELKKIPEADLEKVTLMVDEVDCLLERHDLVPLAIKAKTIVGLSATLGGEVGLRRYEDFFKGHAHYQWFIPEREEKLDLTRLRLDTWVAGSKKNYSELAKLVIQKQIDLGLPTLVLVDSVKMASTVAAGLLRQEELQQK